MTASTSSKRTKRSTAIRLSLAGLALVGIGAAATTAAWTDNVFFSASASTAKFDLLGSTDNATWSEGNTQGAAIAISGTAFANLQPGEAKTTTVYVKNNGTIDAVLSTPTASGSGTIFSGGKAAGVTVVNTGGTTLTPGAVTALTVTVTPPATWNGDTAYQSATGSVLVTVLGTSN